MGVPTSGPGLLKFVTIALYAIVLFGLVISIGKALVVWKQTGDWKPTVDATLGQILYWDNQIYEGVQYLKDDSLLVGLPDDFREDFKNFVIKQIVFYLILFVIFGYALFKFGNWAAGRASFDPTTDLMIVAIIIFGIFPMAEFTYGWLMHDELVVPYRGIAQLVRPSTWELMLDGVDSTVPYVDYLGNYSPNVTNETNVTDYYINISSGG